ncbi:MAG: AAA family ATPase, partial [Anaerolineales bacterium]|nr:AAA family ATPase [Anaerolineales bacterium]
MLTITLCHTLAVTCNGQSIDNFASNSVKALLAYLVMHPHQPQPRESLTLLLYADLPTNKARQNFRKTLSRLRQAMKELEQAGCGNLFLITNEAITFAPAKTYQVDVAEFDQALQDAYRIETADASRSRYVARALRQAIQFYRGEFLADVSIESVPFQDWVRHHRERLTQCLLTALHQLGEHACLTGAYEQMVAYGQQQLAVEPWREEAHHQLMVGLLGLGQRSAALAQYHVCRDIMAQQFQVEPSPKITALYERIKYALDEHSAVLNKQIANNVPVSTLPFVGRRMPLEMVLDMLGDPDVRLVTIVGEGGVGKTRLAQTAATRLAGLSRWVADPLFADGIWWVSLAELPSQSNPEEAEAALTSQLLDCLAVDPDGKRSPTAVLQDYLRERQALVVIDNFEHLIAGASILSQLLQTCPTLSILVTSRSALRIYSENLLTLNGLPVPDLVDTTQPQSTLWHSALQFFADTASRITGQQWQMSAETLRQVHHFCLLVRGNPLAIELAAAWLRHIPLEQILHALQKNLDVLATRNRDVTPRHRSIRAVIEYSWQLLSGAEQELFQTAAVLRDAFTLQAIHGVRPCAEKSTLWDTQQTLLGLIDHSLLWLVPNTGRYQMHPLLQQFGQDKARENASAWPLAENEADGLVYLQGHHAAYFLGWLAGLEAELYGARPQPAMEAITAVWEDVRQAWLTAGSRAMLDNLQQAFAALVRYLDLRAAHFEEEVIWRDLSQKIATWPTAVRQTPAAVRLKEHVHASLALVAAQLSSDGEIKAEMQQALQAQDPQALCRAQLAHAYLQRTKGHWQASRKHLDIAYELAKAGNDTRLQIHTLMRYEPYFTGSLEQMEMALSLAEAQADSHLSLMATISLGGGAFFIGHQNRARVAWESALRQNEAFGSPIRKALLLNNLGDIYRFFGDFELARETQECSWQLSQKLGHRQMQMNVTEGLTRTYTALGLYEQAENAVAHCLSFCRTLETWSTMLFAFNAQGHLYRKRGLFDLAKRAYFEAEKIVHD